MGIKERKQRELEKRKHLIIETATSLFASKGFHNVTLDDIAKRIEFSKGTIYSHFKSKEEICAVILLDRLKNLLNTLKEVSNSCQSTSEGIRKCLDAYILFYTNHREYFQLLFFIDIFSNRFRIPEELLKKIQQKKIACLSELQNVLKKGDKSQEMAKHYSFRSVALVLWGMINGLIHLTESRQIKSSDLDLLIDVAFRIVQKGLMENNNKKNLEA